MASSVSLPTLSKDERAINIVNNIYNKDSDKDKDKGGYTPGRALYAGLEIGYVNYHTMLHRGADARYFKAYLLALAAGAAFGFYKAVSGDKEVGLSDRAKAFAKGDATSKCMMVADMLIAGPGAMRLAEEIHLGKDNTAGEMVAAWWAFGLGSDIASYAYQSFVPDVPKKGA